MVSTWSLRISAASSQNQIYIICVAICLKVSHNILPSERMTTQPCASFFPCLQFEEKTHTPCESRINRVTTNDFRPAQEASVPLRCRVSRLFAEYERNGVWRFKTLPLYGRRRQKVLSFSVWSLPKGRTPWLHEILLWRSMKHLDLVCQSVLLSIVYHLPYDKNSRLGTNDWKHWTGPVVGTAW